MAMLSLANVENVVKPPHKPVVSNRHQGLFVEPYLPNSANSTPMAKHPARFTANVPQGDPWPQAFFMSIDTI